VLGVFDNIFSDMKPRGTLQQTVIVEYARNSIKDTINNLKKVRNE